MRRWGRVLLWKLTCSGIGSSFGLLKEISCCALTDAAVEQLAAESEASVASAMGATLGALEAVDAANR